MNLIQISKELQEGQNLLFFNKDLYDIYKGINSNYISVFFNEPSPIKARLIVSIETVVGSKEPALYKLTVPELVNILQVKVFSTKLVIIFNGFHLLTGKQVSVYEELNRNENILFICSFDQEFKKEAYKFYKTFKVINMEEYRLETGKDEINISYPIYLVVSIIGFFIYFKTITSATMGTMLIGGAWFGIIIFRTFIYTGGRP
ncbi:MAG: hypothetical protein Q8M06_05400 [Methanobacteriaceae archaeon]|nr:hypothetical protein [Methanobacteriaceae archaeon]MDZ4171600.1 hypothetical protein [Methanobacteriaceae archaeon]